MTEEEELKKQEMEKAYGEAPKLDLSKVRNGGAAKARGQLTSEMSNKIELANIKARKSKFCFSEEYEFKLPTGGVLYQDAEDEDIRNGIVRLRPMSLADEEILANQTYAKNGSTFRRLLDSCVVNNFDSKNFVDYDVYYLIYALRQISYGKDYELEIKCSECGKSYPFTLSLADMTFEELNKDEKSVKTIKLPVSKYTTTIRCAVIGDIEKLDKFNVDDEDAGEAAKGFAIRTIEILDDKNEPVNPKDFVDFYEAIPTRDRAEITKAFKNIEDMKIPTMKCTCPKCEHVDITDVPISKGFFRY